MTDPLLGDEPLIGLAVAASRFPGSRGAARLHPATLTRWIVKGARALDGRRVRLEACRCGSKWFTSVAALGRFAQALGTPDNSAPPARSPAVRQAASEAAAQELEGLGA